MTAPDRAAFEAALMKHEALDTEASRNELRVIYDALRAERDAAGRHLRQYTEEGKLAIAALTADNERLRAACEMALDPTNGRLNNEAALRAALAPREGL